MSTTARANRTPSRRIVVAVAVAAALAVAGVLIALSARGGTDGDAGRSIDPALVAEVTAAVGGVPQSGATLGRPSAPVVVTEYADLQCPFCAQAAATIVPDVVRRYVRPGVARLEFAPLAFIGGDSTRGAHAAVAAGSQDRLWQYVELLYRLQGEENAGWLDDDLVDAAARALDLDVAAFDAALHAGSTQAALDEAARTATTDGVSSTPAFVVTGPKGRRVVTGADGAAVTAAIEAVK
ncbi:MAG: thioredoxin domain-containing protein [Actinomycetota bacterium]